VTEPRYPYVHVDVAVDAVESVSDELFALGASGIEERDGSTMQRAGVGEGCVTLVASFADDADATRAVGQLDPSFNPRVEHVVGDAWREGWREFFKPARVGRRLIVRPPWEPFAISGDDVLLTLDPGLAFGTGTHETTRLVLAQIDARVKPGDRVLDVGCGSGILSIAAALLGARDIIAIDIDDDSVTVTTDNAQKNGVADRITVSRTPVEQVVDRFVFVVANIETRVLVPMAPALSSRVAAGGTLVLSGILRDQADQVRAAYAAMELIEQQSEGEWTTLVFRA